MAVLDDFTVEIEVDGQAATEYENDEADAESNAKESMTTYVEAQSDKEFAVFVKVARTFDWGKADTLVARLKIDGKAYSGICLTKGLHHYGRLTGEWSGSGNNATQYKYCFSKLETRDMTKDDKVSEFKEKYHNLGLISVEFSREQRLKTHDGYGDFEAMELGNIPEKGLKGRPIDVATSLKKSTGRRPNASATIKVDKRPRAEIHFKYRTRKALQSLLIIERSPTPVPLANRDPEQMTREELEEVVRQQRLVKQEDARVKPEKRSRAETNPPPMPRLKSSKGANGQVIYHLDSEDEEAIKPEKKVTTSGGSPPADEEVEVITL